MSAGSVVPVKTPEGQAELGSRRLRLSQRHRTVLLLVDGRRTEAEVRELAAQVGASGTCFDELLGLSLIALPEPSRVVAPPPAIADTAGRDPLLQTPAVAFSIDSLLPAAATLPRDSLMIDSAIENSPPADSWLTTAANQDAEVVDSAFAQAREALLRMVRIEAPLAGSLTMMRLRRARSCSDLSELLDEGEVRLGKRHRSLAAAQTLTSVRHLLMRQVDSTPPPR